jgi:hypothetical protein
MANNQRPKSLFTQIDEKIDEYKAKKKAQKQREQQQQNRNNTSLF